MVLKIFNTLGRQKQEFKPLNRGKISFYYCGPTVYSQQHIGNLRGAVCADTIRRSLEYLGFKVNFVSNYTDVGHLTSDADEGEDKMEKGAKKEGLSPTEITQKYIALYEKDSLALNILSPTTRCLATAYIEPIKKMVGVLLEKGFAYQTDLAIYFDITKAKDYTRLTGQDLEELQAGAGGGEVIDFQKRHPLDFAIWFFKTGTHKNALQSWDSPWGKPDERQGFPGWHIECSVMAKEELGETIDIHMGGVEHIPTHHTNEIAQSEASNGVKYINYWLHNEHLNSDGEKMSKSLGNVVYVDDIIAKGFHPLALRYLFLQTHYRSKQNFTWQALESAQKGYEHLLSSLAEFKSDGGQISEEFKDQFIEKISDDFNLPQALALVFEILKSTLSDKDKFATILDFDRVLGLELDKEIAVIPQLIDFQDLSEEIKNLVEERNQARENRDWQKSDELREKIESLGYTIKDIQNNTQVFAK